MRLDLDAPHTSAAVRALLWAAARELRPGAPPPTEAAILTVLSTFKAPSFVPLPPLPATAGSHAAEGEAGYTQLTSFPEGLAAFAGVTVEEVRAPGVAETALRGAEARLDSAATAAARAVLATGPQEVAGGAGGAWRPRLGALWDEASLRRYAVAAGFGSGEYGAPLASLTAAATAAAAGVLRAGRRGGRRARAARRVRVRGGDSHGDSGAGARSREIAGSL